MDGEKYILRKLSEGDIKALDALYLMYASKVRDYACRFLDDRGDAEDLTHDIFLKLWEERSRAAEIRSVAGYLSRMTRNAILNIFKHRGVRHKFVKSSAGPGIEEMDEALDAEDLMAMIDAVLQEMPEQRRNVFTMSRYENMTYEEIGRELNISPKTVQYHISVTLNNLRKLLSSLFFLPFI